MFSNIKYRKTHILFTVVEVLLVILISGWYYFSERKMGMIRHILFRNVYKFPKYFSETNIKLIIGAFVVLLLLQLFLVIKAKKFVLSFVVNVVLVVLSSFVFLKYNADSLFIYYYIIIFCSLFNLVRFCQFLTLKFK